MKYLTYKDLKNRKQYFKNETKSKINKIVYTYLLQFKNIKKFHFFKNTKKFFSFKTRVKPRCIFTGTSRSVNKKFSVSRSKLRELMSLGIISGYKKAVW